MLVLVLGVLYTGMIVAAFAVQFIRHFRKDLLPSPRHERLTQRNSSSAARTPKDDTDDDPTSSIRTNNTNERRWRAEARPEEGEGKDGSRATGQNGSLTRRTRNAQPPVSDAYTYEERERGTANLTT